MEIDEVAVCEMWDLAWPTIPPRSPLYHLEPVGIGTRYVESLTGYIARLAQAYNISVSKFLQGTVRPLLGKNRESARNHVDLLRPHSAMNLNGGENGYARQTVETLEQLTANRNLRFLTMSPWAHVLDLQGLFRRDHAWCPACYEDWRRTGHVIYEPLLWALDVVTVCPIHRRPLHLQCPNPGCQKLARVLSARSRPGYCPWCGCWLGGSTSAAVPVSATKHEKEEAKWQLWIAQRVGMLIAFASRRKRIPGAVALEWIMKDVVYEQWHSANLSQEELGRYLYWTRSGSVELSFLLRLCYRLGISPHSLMNKKALQKARRRF